MTIVSRSAVKMPLPVPRIIACATAVSSAPASMSENEEPNIVI